MIPKNFSIVFVVVEDPPLHLKQSFSKDTLCVGDTVKNHIQECVSVGGDFRKVISLLNQKVQL